MVGYITIDKSALYSILIRDAIARHLADYIVTKIGSTYKVRKGDGLVVYENDDASKAISYAINNADRGIAIASGNYDCKSEILVENKSGLVIYGGGATLLGRAISDKPLITLHRCSYIFISSLFLDALGNFFACLNISASKNIFIFNCLFNNGYDRNVWVWDGETNIKSENIVLVGNYIGKRMIRQGLPRMLPEDPSMDVNQVDGVVIDSNVFEGETSMSIMYPLLLLWTEYFQDYVRNVVISNNVFRKHNYTAIRVVHSSGVIISNNILSDVDIGIDVVDDSSYDVVISNNVVKNVKYSSINMRDQNIEVSMHIKDNLLGDVTLGCRGIITMSNNVLNKLSIYVNRDLTVDMYQNDINSMYLYAQNTQPSAKIYMNLNVVDRNLKGFGHPTLGDRTYTELKDLLQNYAYSYINFRNYDRNRNVYVM